MRKEKHFASEVTRSRVLQNQYKKELGRIKHEGMHHEPGTQAEAARQRMIKSRDAITQADTSGRLTWI